MKIPFLYRNFHTERRPNVVPNVIIIKILYIIYKIAIKTYKSHKNLQNKTNNSLQYINHNRGQPNFKLYYAKQKCVFLALVQDVNSYAVSIRTYKYAHERTQLSMYPWGRGSLQHT